MARRRFKFNKKASLVDLIFVGIFLLSLAVTTLVIYKLMYDMNDRFQGLDMLDDRGKTSFQEITDMYPGVIDNSYLFLAIGISLLILFLAMAVRIHPVFLIFFIILLAVVIFLNGIFSNIYLQMANNPALIDRADELTYTTLLMGRWPFIIGIFGFILAIVQYKNWKEDA